MAFLARQGIGTGSGSRSLPYPMPDTEAEGTRDVAASLAAGLVVRPFADTLRDTLSWLRTAGGPVAGLSVEEERAVLAAWHAEHGA